MAGLMEVMRGFAHEVGGERHDLTIKARREFLNLLERRDADGAVKAMESHVKQLSKRYEKVVQNKSRLTDEPA